MLNKEILKQINKSNKVKGMLADKFNKSHQTIQRWIDNNDPLLTTIDALEIYENELNINRYNAVK